MTDRERFEQATQEAERKHWKERPLSGNRDLHRSAFTDGVQWLLSRLTGVNGKSALDKIKLAPTDG